MNLKDKAFLEKLRIKESSILIGLENFGATVSHYGLIGVVLPPSINKWPNLHPSESSQPNFYILPIKALLPYFYLR